MGDQKEILLIKASGESNILEEENGKLTLHCWQENCKEVFI